MPTPIDVTTPADDEIIAVFPDIDRTFKINLQAWLEAEHYESSGTGRHKFGDGNATARDAAVTAPATGNIWFNTADGVLYVYDGTDWVPYESFAIGDIKISSYDPTTAAGGWLPCDGQAVNRTTYAALFAKIGVLYGDPGPTEFNLPNLTNSYPAGIDQGGAPQADYDTLGKVGGSQDHTVDEANIAEVDLTAKINDSGHAHNVGLGGPLGSSSSVLNATGSPPTFLGTTSNPTGITLNALGQVTPDPIDHRDPFVVVGYLIRVL